MNADLRASAFLTLPFASIVLAEIHSTTLPASALTFAVFAIAAAATLFALAPNLVVTTQRRAVALTALLFAEIVNAQR